MLGFDDAIVLTVAGGPITVIAIAEVTAIITLAVIELRKKLQRMLLNQGSGYDTSANDTTTDRGQWALWIWMVKDVVGLSDRGKEGTALL